MLLSILTRASKLIITILWITLCYVLALFAKRAGWQRIWQRITRIGHVGVLRLLGITLHVHGEISEARPLLLISNHISYLDIPILGSQAPVRFTPKQEINGWFGVGHICRLLDCIFIDRRAEQVKLVAQSLNQALEAHSVLSIFPEATTGNGIHRLPFKAGLFGFIQQDYAGKPLTIQPAAITYTHARRLPLSVTQWPHIAWYGDMELVPHLWELLTLTPLTAELHFLPPLDCNAMADRKTLARACETAIDSAMQH